MNISRPWRIWLTFNPYETVIRPPLLTDWLELTGKGQQKCVNKMIEMCKDLHINGMDCRYLKWFGDNIGELKSRTSDGGARVYLFRVGKEGFALTRAECKNEDESDPELVDWTFEVAALYEQDFDVLDQ